MTAFGPRPDRAMLRACIGASTIEVVFGVLTVAECFLGETSRYPEAVTCPRPCHPPDGNSRSASQAGLSTGSGCSRSREQARFAVWQTPVRQDQSGTSHAQRGPGGSASQCTVSRCGKPIWGLSVASLWMVRRAGRGRRHTRRDAGAGPKIRGIRLASTPRSLSAGHSVMIPGRRYASSHAGRVGWDRCREAPSPVVVSSSIGRTGAAVRHIGGRWAVPLAATVTRLRRAPRPGCGRRAATRHLGWTGCPPAHGASPAPASHPLLRSAKGPARRTAAG
jgi:hypothetical protein